MSLVKKKGKIHGPGRNLANLNYYLIHNNKGNRIINVGSRLSIGNTLSNKAGASFEAFVKPGRNYNYNLSAANANNKKKLLGFAVGQSTKSIDFHVIAKTPGIRNQMLKKLLAKAKANGYKTITISFKYPGKTNKTNINLGENRVFKYNPNTRNLEYNTERNRSATRRRVIVSRLGNNPSNPLPPNIMRKISSMM